MGNKFVNAVIITHRVSESDQLYLLRKNTDKMFMTAVTQRAMKRYLHSGRQTTTLSAYMPAQKKQKKNKFMRKNEFCSPLTV